MTAAPARPDRGLAWLIWLAALWLTGCSREPAPDLATNSEAVVVYSTIGDAALRPVFDAYKEATGTTVVLLNDDEARDANHPPPARPEPDLYIADGIAELWQAAEDNGLRPTRSELIERRIPPRLRDPEHLWVSLSTRPRVVVHNPELTSEAELATVTGYTSLADQAWRGRLCLSSFSISGNDTLVAMLIHALDQREAERTVRGWRANLATALFADEAGLLQAVADGDCAIAIAASSEIARFLDSDSDATVLPHRFPEGGVVHENASGAGVTRHAGNANGAALLLEWLTSETANATFAATLLEFPANPGAATDPAIAAWSGFEPHSADLASLGFLLEDARQLAERARYR